MAHGCTIATADDWREGRNHGDKTMATTYDVESDEIPTDEEIERAERIALCVNACAGTPSDHLTGPVQVVSKRFLAEAQAQDRHQKELIDTLKAQVRHLSK